MKNHEIIRMQLASRAPWNETLPRMPDGSQALKCWYDCSQANVAYQDGAAGFTAACKHYLSRADTADLSATTALMGGAWVKLTTVGANRVLVCKGASIATAGTLEYSLAYIHSVTNFRFAVSDGSTVTSVTDTGAAPSAGVWYFLRFGLRSGTLYISRNAGAEITSAACPDIQDAAGAFSLGGCGDLANYHNGALDSVYITKTDDTSQRAALYNSGLARRWEDCTAANGLDVFATNCLAWYNLSEATGSATWYDSAGTNHLTFTADPIISPTVLNGGFETRGTNGGLTTGVVSATRARTSNVATVTTTLPHGFVSTNVATAITGFTDTTFNGTNKTITRVDDNTFTYPSTGDDVTAGADTGGRFATDVFGGWSESVAGSSTISADTAAPYAGTYAVRFDVDAAGSSAYVLIPSILVSTKRYALSFWAKCNATPASIYTGSSGASQFVSTLTASYAQYSGAFSADGASLMLSKNSAASKSIYIDNVTLASAELVSVAGIAQGPCADTDGVAKWLDSSGFGQHLTQTDKSKRLAYRTNQQNSLPGILGVGGDDSLMIASDLIGVGDVTVFCVFKATGWGGGGDGRIIENGKFVFNVTSAKLRAASDNATFAYSAVASLSLGSVYVVMLSRTSAGVVNFYINGVLSGTANQSSGTPAVAATPTTLANYTAGTRGFDGNIYAAGVYGIILTAPQIAALTTRLKTTWGV